MENKGKDDDKWIYMPSLKTTRRVNSSEGSKSFTGTIAAILEAEGLKKSAVLKAEGEKEAAINRAEGEKKANILRAEGVAQARILEADGEKEAIQRIINALADKGQPDKYLIAMKYLETMQAITSGQDNKVVYMPYEATGILSSVDGIKQMFDANK